MKRSRLKIARAVLRLSGESHVPIEKLRSQAKASTRSIIRWISQGRSGVFLDGYHKPGVGWMSSFAALERFFAELHHETSASGMERDQQHKGGGP